LHSSQQSPNGMSRAPCLPAFYPLF
jgi:hypothetical protein